MECFPAIDLRGGRSVRLLRGDFGAESVYGDPVDQAVRYEKSGAAFLHVVDLDAARTGEPMNENVIARIVQSVEIPIEVGGGIRSTERAAELFAVGVARVVLGTRAVEEPAFAVDLARRYPGQVVLGLDYRRVSTGGVERRKVSVRGWEADSGVELHDLVELFESTPFAAIVATDIGQDGTLDGPDVDGYQALVGSTRLPIVASGGVGTLDHLRTLRNLAVGERRLAGVIVGKALVEGAFTVEEAVAACRP